MNQCVEGLLFIYLFIWTEPALDIRVLKRPYTTYEACDAALDHVLKTIYPTHRNVAGGGCMTVDEFVSEWRCTRRCQ